MTGNILLSSLSHVEDLPEPMPMLFSTITEEDDALRRWTLEKFPVTMHFVTIDDHGEMETTVYYPIRNKETSVAGMNDDEDESVDCTVVYMARCMPLNKCKISCTSMGASAYRWFHDACCQCIGPKCINYGMNTSKCLRCPIDSTQDDDSSDPANNTQDTIVSETDDDGTTTLSAETSIQSIELQSQSPEQDESSHTMTGDIDAP